MNSITLAIIIKDEETFLNECLSSVNGLVDEIVLVDTGSTDQSIDIARNFTDRIFEIEWINDFSAARNFALQQVRTDWVLHLDADEYLTPNGKEKIRELSPKHIDIYQLDLIEENGEFLSTYPRLFKKSAVTGYHGRIHENLTYKSGVMIESTGIPIMHRGYSKSSIEQKNKAERNYRLLSEAINESPDDPFYNYLFARELDRRGDNSAIDRYEKALSVDNGVLGPDFFSHYATALAKQGLFERALNVVNAGLLEYDSSVEIYFLLGLLSSDTGRLDDALRAFERCLSLVSDTKPGKVAPFLVWRGIGLVYEKKKDDERAIKAYSAAIAMESGDEFSRNNLIQILKPRMTDEEIDRFLKNIFK